MIAIDTDVLAVHHIFHNHPRHEATKAFFSRIGSQKKGVAIFNLLELCGLFASANRPGEAREIFEKYVKAENVSILFPRFAFTEVQSFWLNLVTECFFRTQKGMRLGDAAILWTLETNDDIEAFITWNTRHFKGKTSVKILDPSEFA